MILRVRRNFFEITTFPNTFLIWSSRSDELFATPSDVGGEEKELISYAGSGLQTHVIV